MKLIAVSLSIQHTNSNVPIAANVDIGTTVFIEIGASNVNFFGGRSTSYEKKMQEMYNRFIETLKQHVHAIRSDAIIGLGEASSIQWHIKNEKS